MIGPVLLAATMDVGGATAAIVAASLILASAALAASWFVPGHVDASDARSASATT
jgi:hypothetical protein